jgi:hypothetical protein
MAKILPLIRGLDPLVYSPVHKWFTKLRFVAQTWLLMNFTHSYVYLTRCYRTIRLINDEVYTYKYIICISKRSVLRNADLALNIANLA